MSSLKDLLDRAALPPESNASPMDDLARGHAARRRHQVKMTAAGVGASALLVGVVGTTAGFIGTPSGQDARPAAASSTSPKASHSTTVPFGGSIGDRPLTLRYVPAGWKIQGWGPTSVVLVHSNGSPATTVLDFEGKIAIMLDEQTDVTGPVRVINGKQFTVGTASPDTPVVQSTRPTYNGAYLSVQGIRGISTDELLKIAAGAAATSSGTPAIG